MSVTVEKCIEGWTNSLRQLKAQAEIVFFGDSLVYYGDFASLFPDKVVCNLGLRGDTLLGLKNRVEQVKLVRPKVVYLMAGINDVANCTVEEFSKRYESLIQQIVKHIPLAGLVVFSLLPVNDVDFSISCSNMQIGRANETIADLCTKHGLPYVDLYAVYEQSGMLPKEMTTDGVHLLEKEYSRWFQVVISLNQKSE